MERMYHEDLRAWMALEFYKLYIHSETDDPSHGAAIHEADLFLAELDRTAKPVPWPADALERIEWWTGNSAAWMARAEAADARAADFEKQLRERQEQIGIACLKHDLVSGSACPICAKQMEERMAEAGAHIVASDATITRLNAQLSESLDRLAAIDAAKAEELPCPIVSGVPYPSECSDGVFKLSAWGHKGWDVAAALGSELAQMKMYRPRDPNEMCFVVDNEEGDCHWIIRGLKDGFAALEAKLAKHERERIIALLDRDAPNQLILRSGGTDLFGDCLRDVLKPTVAEVHS